MPTDELIMKHIDISPTFCMDGAIHKWFNTHQPQRHCKCLQQTVHQHYSSRDQHHRRRNHWEGRVLRLQPTQINITTEQVLATTTAQQDPTTSTSNTSGALAGTDCSTSQAYAVLQSNDSGIPHVWRLANIMPIPKPNGDINIGTSCRPISLLSVIAETLEKVILPYMAHNMLNVTARHGFKARHSTGAALHNISSAVAAGFGRVIPPTSTIAVALDMGGAFDTVDKHTLMNRLTQTNMPHTILGYIANYIGGRMAYTTFRTHTSTKREFKSGVPLGGVLSPILTHHLHFRHPTTTRLCTTDHIRGRHNYHSTTH